MDRINKNLQFHGSPDKYFRGYTAIKLAEYKSGNCFTSDWPTMEKIANSKGELSLVFSEISDRYQFEGFDRGNYSSSQRAVLMILEHIWGSSGFSKTDIFHVKEEIGRISALSSEVQVLCAKLSQKLKELDDPKNSSILSREGCQDGVTAFLDAGKKVPYFEIHLEKTLKGLSQRFGGRYWPSRYQYIDAIAEHESSLPKPPHHRIPLSVLEGRSANIKNFVLSFDSSFNCGSNDLPPGFRFSDNAMADLANFVLDIDSENPITPDAVRLVRHRYPETCSPKID